MTNKEAITILKNEVKCIQLQDTPKCARFVGGTCAVCPLVLPTATVLEAYRLAMDALAAKMPKAIGTVDENGNIKIELIRPHGEWLPTPDDLAEFKCSICDKPHFWKDNFCPNCGARMEGGKE